MRSCARRWGRGRLSLPGIPLLLIPPFLLALQLLVVGPRLPPTARAGVEQEVVFSVISIEPDRNSRQRGSPSRGPGLEEEEKEEEQQVEVEDGERGKLARAYEDENEMHSRQLDCSRVLSPGRTQASRPPEDSPWLLCAEDWLLPSADMPCVAYSFSMDGLDADFLKTVSGLGCEVHSFDPSISSASGGHLGNSLASNHGDGGVVSQHKMWLEWRAARKRKQKTRGSLGSVSQTLADIMASLGHRTVHFLYADLLSAEWRVFQNWIESGTLQRVRHLVAQVHLQWAGFEVGGTNEEVLRYWFSVLQGLQASGLKLVHSSAGEGHSVLKQTVANGHSSYMLSWTNTRR
ncbi:probable methyltransferase-like protein 24 isoform X2 [Clinocottus analis]|uniref:probable methyltransferase-like protein 24 isoform X2 n=1 Tax=Clinocottus analis TaxID=304258 RepID=UPI0035C159C4